MKDTFYFSHDYNTRQDIKIRKLLFKHGYLGYGLFWAIIEDLYNNANALPIDYESMAYELRVDVGVLTSVINDFGLFVISKKTFGSVSIEKRLDERNLKTTKAKQSAFARWDKVRKDAELLRTHQERNAKKDINETKDTNQSIESIEIKDENPQISTEILPPTENNNLSLESEKENTLTLGAGENLAVAAICSVAEIKTKNDIEKRKLQFADELKQFTAIYNREVLIKFYNYWTEPNKTNTKFRKELEKTWSLASRLQRWSSSDFNKKSEKESNLSHNIGVTNRVLQILKDRENNKPNELQ